MKEISKMRLGIIRELKNVRLLLDHMEKKIKSREPRTIEEGYMFLQTLVIMLDIGELSPKQVALNLEIAKALHEAENDRLTECSD